MPMYTGEFRQTQSSTEERCLQLREWTGGKPPQKIILKEVRFAEKNKYEYAQSHE